MTPEEVRRIAKEVYDEQATEDQFAVPAVPLHFHNNIDAPRLPFIGLADVPNSYYSKAGNILQVNETESGLSFGTGYLMVTGNTNGTTNVDVFGTAGAPYAFTIVGVFLISLDTTAGNITVINAGNTVCTIAKGVTAGVLVGATSLSNTSVAKAASFQVDSSSAGNATVFIAIQT